MSLPSRERGLKSLSWNKKVMVERRSLHGSVDWNLSVVQIRAWMVSSLPSRERGLKYRSSEQADIAHGSLPSRERGLKCVWVSAYHKQVSVAPFTGAWIEICTHFIKRWGKNVAPFTGAWIEILLLLTSLKPLKSLPSRERGLKFSMKRVNKSVITSLPSRERGLKLLWW